MLNELMIYSGLVASIWFIFCVVITGSQYHGYNHLKQFCSELGAAGSPTEKLTPLINHYPLGILFCLFGWYVTQLQSESFLMMASGWLIIIHGIGTWVAGYFPMDADAYTKTPSFNCKVHTLAGVVMLLALLVSPILIAFVPQTDHITTEFKVFSIVCTLATIIFLITLTKAITNKTNPGIHQRLSYGVQLLWLSGFSLMLGQ